MGKIDLLEALKQYFDENEIQDICFELNIDYESLPAEGKGYKSRELVKHLDRRGRIDELLRICRRLRPDVSWTFHSLSNRSSYHYSTLSILFLAADPTDTSRLRLGEELREIQERLQLANLRERFELHQRMSVRPVDISQALLDVQPQIVHFSGHGTSTGALCFEDQLGSTQPIQPDALAALFEQFANQVSCVVLNACYSEIQATAIAKHIDHVIGMNQAIGDKAAIAFAVGFYQALGAGRSIKDAYKLGCVQIRLQSIPEHLTPVLIKRASVSSYGGGV